MYCNSAVSRRIFIPLNFNQFNNRSFFLPNYFITLFSCLTSKISEIESKFCQSVCLTVRTPILLLKSWSRYMYHCAQENSECRTASTWLIQKLCLFGCFFEEIKFTANEKSSIQVSPRTVHMQKFYPSYMHSSFLCHLLIYYHSVNVSNSSKYCN